MIALLGILLSVCALTIHCVCRTGVEACFVDPCLLETCSNHPYAICRANYCNGCFAEFYEGDKRVDCMNVTTVNVG